MYKEPRPMKEIHEIQKRFYEEEKNLPTDNLIAKIHREAEEVKKKYCLKFKKPSLN
ncbi:MAG: hypothetical protein AB1414_05715 [bacterium]